MLLKQRLRRWFVQVKFFVQQNPDHDNFVLLNLRVQGRPDVDGHGDHRRQWQVLVLRGNRHKVHF